MSVYYNEFDPKTAAWLRELIKEGHIADGYVDERSIIEVKAHELTGFSQHHFFAGIGGWSLALRLAGWPDDNPVWTGSCPCQPFSIAGKQMGNADSRHLWPAFRRLINRAGPATVFGEQVASKDGRKWLAGVLTDLETMGYVSSGADLCAAGSASPQIRQRLFWMAHSAVERRREGRTNQRGCLSGGEPPDLRPRSDDNGADSRVGHAMREGLLPSAHSGIHCGKESLGPWHGESVGPGSILRVGNADESGPQRRSLDWYGGSERAPWSSSVGVCGNDGKWRRVEPGVPPLATRLPARVALIRGSGNAIVPQVAAIFIQEAIGAIAESHRGAMVEEDMS